MYRGKAWVQQWGDQGQRSKVDLMTEYTVEPIQITDQMSLFIVHTSVQHSGRNHSQINTHCKYCILYISGK